MTNEKQIQNPKDTKFLNERNSASFTFEVLTIVTTFIKHLVRKK